jgi:CBS domain-containing protein
LKQLAATKNSQIKNKNRVKMEEDAVKVKDIMSRNAVCCSANSNIGQAVELMWVHNCGMLPVVGPDHKLWGIITDRDICIAVGTRNKHAGELTVAEVASKEVFSCRPEDDVQAALRIMASKHVRRLPVVDNAGIPLGILSTDDVVAHGGLNKWAVNSGLPSEEIIGSLKKLYGQQFPMVRAITATV